MSTPLLEVKDLKVHFPITKGIWQKTVGHVKAVDGVSLKIHKGETLGIVGESGCGKTTLGRAICRLLEITDGKVLFDNGDVAHLKRADLFKFRKHIQMIFQDPYSSLNPRRSVKQTLEEAYKLHGIEIQDKDGDKLDALLKKVGLGTHQKNKFPHEFSGGQRQRIGIARALALQPELIICDEAVSALDVSVQSQILNLLVELQAREKLTYLFISHDLSVVKYISDRVAIMYLGRVVEVAKTEDLFSAPKHPYTVGLLDSIPLPDPKKRKQTVAITGDIPSPANPPSGCRFHTRCPHAMDVCKQQSPELKSISGGNQDHEVACHLFENNGEKS